MSLTRSQKKFIKKNDKKKSIAEIARILNISQESIKKYLLNSDSSQFKFTKQQDLQNETVSLSYDIISQPMMWIKKNLVFFVILAILVIASYANALGNGFVSDDRGLVINLPVWDAHKLFTDPYPFLRVLLYLVIYKIAGLSPFAFRIPDIIFHAGVVFLIFLILSIMQKPRVGIIAAALFAVHPILVESVTWISGGAYVQYSFFFLLSLFFYMLAKNIRKYILSLIFFILALLSSEKAVALVLVYPLYEIIFGSLLKNWKKLAPFFLVTGFLVLSYLRLVTLRAGLSEGQQLLDSTLYNPFLQVPIAISSYLQLLFWPDGLTLYHSEMSFSQLEYFIRVGVLISLLSIIIISFIKNRFIFFWLTFFIVTLLPTINPFVNAWVVAERYVYLGTLGIFASLGWVFSKLLESKKIKRTVISFFAIIIVLLLIRTISRNADWKSEDTLWVSAIRTSPSSSQNHNNLGDYYGRHGDLVNSIAEFKKAIELKPNYADAYHNLGNAYRDSGNLDLAIQSYQKALSIVPSIWQSYLNIAAIYYSQGNFSLAKQYAEKGLKVDSQNVNLLAVMGLCEYKLGEKNKARDIFLNIITIDPNNQFAKETLFQIQNDSLK